ncbi:MAG TPA: hypothetical protein VLE49_03670 [Anaerolineales bacterium]|nr:hypothetical protein [Anaerolineales bacterium]
MTEEVAAQNVSTNKRIKQTAWIILAIVFTFLLGIGSGYLKWGQDETAKAKQQKELTQLYEQVNPKDGYTLPVSYGDLGPQLLQGGVIQYDAIAALYEQSGQSLSAEEIAILKKGSDKQITINAQNSRFLLNLFWAVGLANKNPILTEGLMVQNSGGQVEGYASTGGWGLAAKPVTELYASMDLIPLTAEQQKSVEEVASAVYRPCCNNPTHFPDCNHGMAMLGILELMASKGASTDEMFQAAKYVNAYWFPQQTLETAAYLKSNKGTDFVDADARLVVGQKLSSASGSAMVHSDLQAKGLLQQAPGQGGNCAN